MASITLGNRVWYKSGTSGASYVVGYEASSNRVVRYTLVAPSTGASNVSLTFQGNYFGEGSYPSLRFYIGTSATSHANAGAGSTYTGSLTRNDTTYTGSASIILMPNETYYVWVFPADTTYGWLYWSATTGDATATTSGGAYSTMEIDTPQTLDEAFNIAVTRYDSSFTHTVTYTCGTATGTICTKSSTIPISCKLPLSLASQAPNATSVYATLTLTTYSGNTAVGSVSKKILCLIPSSKVAPTLTVDFSDAMGYANVYGDYVQGRSKLYFKVNATGAYGATIKSYEISCNGETFTTAEGTTGVLTTAGSISFRVVITDSRHQAVTQYFYPYVLAYTAPKITALSVKRCSDTNGTEDDQGGYVQVKTSASITSLSGKNSSTIQLWYKQSAATDYTKITLSTAYSITNHTYTFAADTGSSYDVKIVATDNFGSATKTTSVSTGYTILHWKANGRGMAAGKISELDDVFDFGFQVKFTGGIRPIVLEPETDLNDVRTPNKYVGEDLQTYGYVNCPLTKGTFMLEVVGMGDKGQCKQILTSCFKEISTTLQRFYYSDSWGAWQWEHPPMAFGVEYCTTERFNGKAVYTKAVNWGALPNTELKTYDLPNPAITAIVDFRVIAHKEDTNVFNSFPWIGDSGTAVGKAAISTNNAYVKTFSNLSAHNAYAIFKYTID